MVDVYEHRHAVTADEMDSLGHANNVAYVRWLQDAAVAHSAAQGWPNRRYREMGQGWVVRSHTIEYLAPAVAGDAIVVRTWVATMRKATSVRRYRIVREGDGAVLAVAETRWAYIDFATGQPTRVPAEVAASFVVVDSP